MSAQHRPTVTNEIRETAYRDGDRYYEPTGRACMVCRCGTTTGFVPNADAVAAAEQHWSHNTQQSGQPRSLA